MKNGIKIMNVEGAEILKRVNNENYQMKYTCVFANSMLLDKLKELKLKVTKTNTTRDIIGVKFSYGYHEELSAKDVREKLYTEGFSLVFNKIDKKTGEIKSSETIDYVFFFRSASKSRVGDCFFINKKLKNKIDKWQTMGIELPKENAKLVEMESYKGLTSSATEGYIHLDAKSEILVVNDLDSYSDLHDIISIEKDNNDNVVAIRRKDRCKNVIWDGMSLADVSLFNDEYKNNSILVLRHHFFKTCAFNTNIQQFIKDYCDNNNIDYDTYTLTDRYDRKILAKNIKLITTENSMKWEKFGVSMEYWCDKVAEDNNTFGVCKVDHDSKYDNLQRMSYQMINSLPINELNLKELIADTTEFVDRLKNDDDFFVEHLKRTASEVNINMLLVYLYKQNKFIVKSKMFKKVRTELISAFVKKIKAGKVLVNANNLTVCANPHMLLLYSVNELDKYINDNVIERYVDNTLSKVNSCYTNRFADNEELAIFRNPHNAPNNIGYVVNTKHELMNKYFNFNSNVIAINLLNNDIQDRMSGMDEDSDFVFTTNNKQIVQASILAQSYCTMINNIKQSKKTYNNNMIDLAIIDNTLAEAKEKIGETSNLAQILLSYMWDYRAKGLDYTTYENEVCKLAVFAQIAIDNAKRQYDVDLDKEMNTIRRSDLLNKLVLVEKEYYTKKKNIRKTKIVEKKEKFGKPTFWQYTNTETSLKQIEKNLKKKDWFVLVKDATQRKNIIKEVQQQIINSYADLDCPMCHLDKTLDISDSNKSKTIDDSAFLVYYICKNDSTKTRTARRKANKIEEIVAEFDNQCKSIKCDEDNIEEYQIAYDECFDKVQKVKIDIYSMSLLISRILDNNNKYLKTDKHLKCKLLNILYRKDRDMFLQCFKDDSILEEINSNFC